MSESQADYLLEIDPQLLAIAKMRKPDDFENELNQLIQDIHFQKFDFDNGRPPPDYSKLWFPTPETCTDLSKLSPLQREFYDQILQLQRCEKINAKTNSHDRQEFLKIHTQKRLPPGSLVSYFDSLNQRYIYNLVSKTRFFHKSTYESLQLSLMALRQHLERHTIRALSIPRLGSGFDRLHWPTVFSILYRVFSKSQITITIVQRPR